MIESADQRWKDFYDRLQRQSPDDVNHSVFKEAMRPANYPAQVKLIIDRFPIENMDILEIGCGFGGLCYTVHQNKVPKSYTVVDNPEMLKFTKETLKGIENISFINAPDMDTINWGERKYDLLISNYCISETPKEYQDFVFEKVFPVCGNIFMLDGDKKSDYPNRLKLALAENFSNVVLDGYCLDWRVDLYVAKYNKSEYGKE